MQRMICMFFKDVHGLNLYLGSYLTFYKYLRCLYRFYSWELYYMNAVRAKQWCSTLFSWFYIQICWSFRNHIVFSFTYECFHNYSNNGNLLSVINHRLEQPVCSALTIQSIAVTKETTRFGFCSFNTSSVC